MPKRVQKYRKQYNEPHSYQYYFSNYMLMNLTRPHNQIVIAIGLLPEQQQSRVQTNCRPPAELVPQ